MPTNTPQHWPSAPIIRIRRGHMPPCGDLSGRIAYRETPEPGYYVPDLDVGLWQSNTDLQLDEWEDMVAVPKRIVDELGRRVAAHDDGYQRHEPVDGLYGLKDQIVNTSRGVVRQADAGGEATE